MQANWVKQAVSAGGTGALTLGSADAGNITLNSAVGVGPSFHYVIEDGNDKETGFGHLSASTTLVRDYVRETLVSGTYDNTSPTAINVTTSAKVMISATAAGVVEAMPRPCGTSAAERRVILTPNTSISSYSTDTLVADYVYAVPFYWPGGRPIGNIYADVFTAAAAGKLLRVGIAVPNDDWSACAVVADVGGVAADSTGLKTFALGSALNLPAGWYVGLVCSNGAPVMRCSTWSGSQDPWGWHATTPTYKIVRRYKAFTYGALPSTIDLINTTTVQNSSGYSSNLCLWAGE